MDIEVHYLPTSYTSKVLGETKLLLKETLDVLPGLQNFHLSDDINIKFTYNVTQSYKIIIIGKFPNGEIKQEIIRYSINTPPLEMKIPKAIRKNQLFNVTFKFKNPLDKKLTMVRLNILSQILNIKEDLIMKDIDIGKTFSFTKQIKLLNKRYLYNLRQISITGILSCAQFIKPAKSTEQIKYINH